MHRDGIRLSKYERLKVNIGQSIKFPDCKWELILPYPYFTLKYIENGVKIQKKKLK